MPDTPTGRDLDAALWSLQNRPIRRICAKGSGEIVLVFADNPALSDGVWTRDELERYGAPPPYSSSRDEMARVEDELGRRGLLDKYVEALGDLLCAGGGPFRLDGKYLAMLATAPAAVRAAAALAVLSEGVK